MEHGSFASSQLTVGQLNAIVKKLGGHDDAVRFLRGELVVSERVPSVWREEDGVIYFSVTSNGRTGEEWIEYLKFHDLRVAPCVRDVLRSRNFASTTGITMGIAILKASLFKEEERTTQNIRAEAKRRGLRTPTVDTACLIYEKFTQKEMSSMGLGNAFMVMHEPMWVDGMHHSIRLGFLPSNTDGSRLLDVYNAGMGKTHVLSKRIEGFAFAQRQLI